VAAAIAVAALTQTVTSSAAAEPKLPARTAAQLLAAVETARPPGFSGTIVANTKLGLPQLPQIGGAGGGDASLSLTNLITGAHTLRVWYAGKAQQRLALLGQLSESDVVHNGRDLWTYTSTSRQVTHSSVPKADSETALPQHLTDLTPQQAAEKALKAIDPTTAVQVDRTAQVAGRAAYQLLLMPKDTRSLIGSVRIAIDAHTSMPLRVQVFARSASSPAIQIGFTDVSFKVPDASVFHFVPPAGSTVVQGNPLSDMTAGPAGSVAREVGPFRHGSSKQAPGQVQTLPPPTPAVPGRGTHTKVLGSGWTAVVETGALTPSNSPSGPSFGDLLNKVATPVQGGRVISSALLSVFIADNGRVFVGPVSTSAIEKIAATGHGL